MKFLKWIGALLVVMVAAGGAYQAATQATRRREQATKERDLEALVSHEGQAAIEAGARARVHEKAAEEASRRASARIERIARIEPELSEVVSALNTRSSGQRRRRAPAGGRTQTRA